MNSSAISPSIFILQQIIKELNGILLHSIIVNSTSTTQQLNQQSLQQHFQSIQSQQPQEISLIKLQQLKESLLGMETPEIQEFFLVYLETLQILKYEMQSYYFFI